MEDSRPIFFCKRFSYNENALYRTVRGASSVKAKMPNGWPRSWGSVEGTRVPELAEPRGADASARVPSPTRRRPVAPQAPTPSNRSARDWLVQFMVQSARRQTRGRALAAAKSRPARMLHEGGP